jgi:AhpD family alkylhydroperoxidase
MKLIFHLFSLILFFSVAPLFGQAEQTYKDIQQTLGIVPSFLKNYPSEAIPGAWMDMKNLQLNSKTAIPGKYKEMIGLAVAAQVPCRYCTYFHTQAAKLNGASTQELKETLAIAAITRRWSAIIEGTQTDSNQFKNEVNSMLEFMKKNQNKQAMEQHSVEPAKEITTAQEAFEDMKMHFGIVPFFVKNYPEASIPGIWQEFKAIELNPDTAIPGKYKDLIALAVSSQIPCQHCIYFDTQSAIAQGATVEEINEAIAMSGITRNWSTVLNGQYTDEKNFEKETNQIMKYLKSKMSKDVSLK